MKILLRKIFVPGRIPRNIKIDYDKTGKIRPAWIHVKGLSPKTEYLDLRFNDWDLQRYRVWMSPKVPMFLPTNYTYEELRKFYNRFSQFYDKFVRENNTPAAKFLISKLKLSKGAKILDLAAGTGLVSEQLVSKGYRNITLLDYSPKMLALAKKKKSLKGCKFIRQDIRKLNLKEKFDLIISVFAFAYSAYYKPEEMPRLWKLVWKHLKPGGILMLFAHDYEPPSKLFKKVEGKTFLFISKYEVPYYIGVKK